MARLIAKAREHAACHGAAPALHQKIGIAARRNGMAKRKPGAVGHRRLENMTSGDDPGCARPGGKNASAIECAHTRPKAKLGTGRTDLRQQGAVERAHARASAHKIE